MSNLDLTKPVRFEGTRTRFYPVITDDFKGPGILGVYVDCGTGCWSVTNVRTEDLENVPEPIVRYAALHILADGLTTIAFGNINGDKPESRNRQDGDVLLKLTRTEDGVTHAEVVDG